MQYVSYLLNMLLYQSTHFSLQTKFPNFDSTFSIFTTRKRSLRRLCFNNCQSFCSRGGYLGRYPPPHRYTLPRPQWMLGYGQQAYASHWNAFLFKNVCRVIVPEYWAVKVTLNEKGPFVDCSEKELQFKPLFQESF